MVAELFPVGEFLAEEFTARGWSQEEFARFTRLPMGFVPGIISGERELTKQAATRIREALGTSAVLWLGLHDDYLAWQGTQSANE